MLHHLLCAFAALLAVGAATTSASAQIKQPGAHPRYSVELEPHLAIQVDRDWRAEDEGIGPGLRATIPLFQNGPISSINNNMGIGFGMDWLRFGDCDGRFGADDCHVDQLWFPVVVQWNFFLTPVVSVFGEPGLAIWYASWGYDGDCAEFADVECDQDDLDPFEPVFFAGGRFLFSRSAGLVVRLGSPYISIGATFLM